MIRHEPGNFSQCRCDNCVDARQEIPALTSLPTRQDDERVLDLVQRHSVTLADLYRRGRAKGLLKGSKGY